MSTKWKLGTKVTVTRECLIWYREHLFEGNSIAGKILPDGKAHTDGLLMWATADLSRPKGEVVYGTPAEPETTVKVTLSNKFGCGTMYLSKDHLLKKK